MSFFEATFEKIAGILFPDRCIGCSAQGSLLCGACLRKIPPAHAAPEPWSTSVFAYGDPRIRRIVKLLKYKNTRHAAKIFGEPLALALQEILGEERLFVSDKILLVPVPLSTERRRMRGYNQAELLARATLAHLAASAPKSAAIAIDAELLEKVRDTKQQAGIKNRAERMRNLGECFRVAAGRASAGETIILIDDVTTTGATLIAARKALLSSGFRHVYALTLAH